MISNLFDLWKILSSKMNCSDQNIILQNALGSKFKRNELVRESIGSILQFSKI